MSSHWQPPMQEHAPHRLIQVSPSNSSAFLADRSLQLPVAPFDMLFDDLLLSIFDFYVHDRHVGSYKRDVETWQSLVHVCQRWRRLVFESPRRLNLRLIFTPKTPMRLLDVWPDLPLCIHGWNYKRLYTASLDTFKDGVIAALKNSDRIRQLIIAPLPSYYQCPLQEFLAVMQVPFPELTELNLEPSHAVKVVPDSFLGGFAPRLRDLTLTRIPFPGLPKLLLSAPHLVNLHLDKIPHDGYILPKDMVAGLSLLTNLSKLTLRFHWGTHRQYSPDHSRHLSPPTRLVLPALTCLEFDGVSKYLDDLVANLDAPQLRCMTICFTQEDDFHSPQLARLINRIPRLEAPKAAHVYLTYFSVAFHYPEDLDFDEKIEVELEIKNTSLPPQDSDSQVLDLAWACASSLPFLSSVEKLYIDEQSSAMSTISWGDGIVNAPWLPLLHSFTGVKELYLSGECALPIARALQGLDGDSVVLPALENIFFSSLVPSGATSDILQQFASARERLTGHSIAVSPEEW